MTTLFHVSDVHFGREDPQAVAAFTAAVAAERPDALLVTGDLTMRSRAAEWAAAGAWLQGFALPMSIEIGNHDVPHLNPLRRFFSPYRRFKRLERAFERPIDLPGVAVVPLRTTSRAQLRLDWQHGHVPRARARRAAQALREAPADAFKIVACHHPLFDRPGGSSEGHTVGGRAALIALAEAGCDMVVSGHVHDPFDIRWEGGLRPVRLVGAGTLSKRTRGSPPSYNRIVITGRDAEVTAVALR